MAETRFKVSHFALAHKFNFDNLGKWEKKQSTIDISITGNIAILQNKKIFPISNFKNYKMN